MRNRGRGGLALFVALAAWAVFTWPLPLHFVSGIPSSDRNLEKGHVRTMIPGDHLQLLYHFRLVEDMLHGDIPPFYNLYEFNTGDDDARFVPDPYYVPFSLVYALGAWAGGPAVGWNLAGLLSILLTYLLTWKLARRYVKDELVAALGALAGFLLPYRWITLLIGSPTGFAMALVPAVLLGLDMAVREQRIRGGLIAGTAILLGYCSDLHVFFFSVLAVPCWSLTALAARGDDSLRACLRPNAPRRAVGRDWLRMAIALVPVALLAGTALGISVLLKQDYAGTDMESGRTLADVARFSPIARGLFAYRNMGVSNHVFFGAAMAALLLTGLSLRTVNVLRQRLPRFRFVVPAMLCAGIAVVVILALGVNGPFNGGLIIACRRLIPRYSMIRQPAKIYCLLPSLLAVAGAMALASWRGLWRARTVSALCLAVWVGAVAVESRFHVSPTICLLRDSQGAYRAVADTARAAGHTPRALIVPLWPGDSHYTSIYQHYVAMYGIRMINGYSPVVSEDYYRNVFKKLESANLGVLSSAQCDELLNRGIEYVIFQEGPFPEKVSPFPAGYTLWRMLSHPRLRLLAQDGLAWAFRILKEAQGPSLPLPEWTFFAPSRTWEAEKYTLGGTPRPDETAGGGFCVALAESRVAFPRVWAPRTRGLRWLVRVKGRGELHCISRTIGTHSKETRRRIDAVDWMWVEVPVEPARGFFSATLKLSRTTGTLLADMVILTAGPWPAFQPGDSCRIYAPCLFRAGYTDLSNISVVFRKNDEADRTLLYGPRMPMPPGEYALGIDVASPAPADTLLGWIEIDGEPRTEVRAGKPAGISWTQETNLPFSFRFVFSREEDMRIGNVVIRRTR